MKVTRNRHWHNYHRKMCYAAENTMPPSHHFYSDRISISGWPRVLFFSSVPILPDAFALKVKICWWTERCQHIAVVDSSQINILKHSSLYLFLCKLQLISGHSMEYNVFYFKMLMLLLLKMIFIFSSYFCYCPQT